MPWQDSPDEYRESNNQISSEVSFQIAADETWPKYSDRSRQKELSLMASETSWSCHPLK
jgi:hypothetical protein